jgi:hypothetical protein
MTNPIIQEEYKGQIIKEQVLTDKKLYIITIANGKYTLWLNDKKLGESKDATNLQSKIIYD